MNAETQKRVDDYRAAHAVRTQGYADVIVEGLIAQLGEVSTEALAFELRARGYTVTLEPR